MTKKQWLWFWLLALLLLILVCVFGKIGNMQPKQAVVPEVKKVVKAVEPAPKVEIVKVVEPKPVVVEVVEVDVPKKDLNFKIVKSKNNLTMSGVLTQKSDFDTLSNNYSGLINEKVSFDDGYENSNILELIIGLKDIFSKFKSGFIEYSDKGLSIDGIVGSTEDKELADSTLASITDVAISSNIVVELPKSKVEHISKLSIVKSDNSIMVSGIFSSEDEIDALMKSLQRDGIDVTKRLCIVDSDLQSNNWKALVDAISSDFISSFSRGTIQFDKDKFDISGETIVEGAKQRVEQTIGENIADLKLEQDISYVKPKPTKQQIQAEINAILKLKSIQFERATSNLTTKGKNTIDEVLEILKKFSNLNISIAGHTDSDGSEMLNLKLSQDRADAVKNYLIKNGLIKDNLTTKGFGEGVPLVENNSDSNKQINRRVEFTIQGE